MLRKRLVAYALQGKNAILTLLLVGVANFFLPALSREGRYLYVLRGLTFGYPVVIGISTTGYQLL